MSDSEIRANVRMQFYRDRFDHVLAVLALTVLVLVGLIGISLYLFFDKPLPITIHTEDKEWRVVASIPLDQSYKTEADLIQWISDSFPKAFTYDFLRIDQQLEETKKYFTAEGWKVFLAQLNNLVTVDKLKKNKLFISAFTNRAPFIEQTGLSQGRRAWLIQIPLKIRVSSGEGAAFLKNITFSVLVVRVPTTTNLSGVAINNIVVTSKSDVTS